jgi:Heat induced stress protein YflT domain
MTIPTAPGMGTGTAPPAPATADERYQPRVTLASYPDYASAQRAVDFLSDNKFPVEHTAIVGTNLSLVENVIGRMTTSRAAASGAAAGAWFGLFIGLLFALFANANWLAVVLTGVIIGAIWGAIFGAIAHAATRGSRDFSSQSSLQAQEYAVNVTADRADAARQLLGRLNLQPSR